MLAIESLAERATNNLTLAWNSGEYQDHVSPFARSRGVLSTSEVMAGRRTDDEAWQRRSHLVWLVLLAFDGCENVASTTRCLPVDLAAFPETRYAAAGRSRGLVGCGIRDEVGGSIRCGIGMPIVCPFFTVDEQLELLWERRKFSQLHHQHSCIHPK